jgi:hypothetical protein
MCEALRAVPAQWRADFCRFVEGDEVSDGFLAFLEQDEACRRACEAVLRSDQETARLLAAAAEPPIAAVDSNESLSPVQKGV